MSRSKQRHVRRQLSDALWNNDVNALKQLLDSGVDVETPCWEHGETPLMLAQSAAAARLLLERGADVNAVDEVYGRSALMWAILNAAQQNKKNPTRKKSEIAVIEDLLEAGAQTDARDKDELCALVCAVRTANIEVIKLLIRWNKLYGALNPHDIFEARMEAEELGLSQIANLLDYVW